VCSPNSYFNFRVFLVSSGPLDLCKNWRFGVVLGFMNVHKSLDELELEHVVGARLIWF